MRKQVVALVRVAWRRRSVDSFSGGDIFFVTHGVYRGYLQRWGAQFNPFRTADPYVGAKHSISK